MDLGNHNPRIQVLVSDQTLTNEGRVLMNSLRGPDYQRYDLPAGFTFLTESPFGRLELHSGGWIYLRRPGVTRIYVVLLEASKFDIGSIERELIGTFQLSFKNYLMFSCSF